MQDKDLQIRQLESSIQLKETQIRQLNELIRTQDTQINSLNLQLQQLQSGIVMHLLNKYQRFMEKLLCTGTRRRYYYDLCLTGIRVILNEGWKSFFRKFKNWENTHKGYKINRSKSFSTFENSPSKLKQLLNTITFPDPTINPEVSIIIPVFNKWQYTANCLYSIFKNTSINYEVIVVDDDSTDETKIVLSNIKNLRFIQNGENLGFVETCNHGAEVSKGNYILFLNNDTIVTPNWLESLLETIKRENVGAVGSKLIYPNGTLQEAGAIIWNNASGWNYGRGDNPQKPEYNYVREVDYCTGACLLVKKELFNSLGGFDLRFRPGYYEETDLCFSIRNRGYKVMYQPMSTVVHFEGITNGTNTSSGIKKYQEINKSKFFEKWNHVLQKYHHDSTPNNLRLARDKRTGKRVLVIDHYLPTYDKDSGSLRMFNILKILSELGHQVTFVGDNLLRMEPYTQELQQAGIEVVYSPFIKSVEGYISNFIQNFDVVILSRPHIAIKYIDLIKRANKTIHIIYDTVDLVSLRESRRATLENNPRLLQQAENTKRVELYLAQNSDLTFVVSAQEKEILLKENPSLKVEIISNIHQVRKSEKLFSQRKDILFVGGFDHSPNVDAVKYFADQIFPLIKQKIPEIRVYIAGSNPPNQILKLNSKDITVTGYVKDLSPYFEDCRVFIAPLRYGAGVKGKINQSMSYGLPVIATPIGAEGMGLIDNVDILIAVEPEQFAEKVVMIYQNENLWNEISINSIENVKKYYSPEVAKARLAGVFGLINKPTQKIDVLSLMRQDWNKRAKENPRYYISYNDTEDEFDNSGRLNVNDFVVKDLDIIANNNDLKKMRVLDIGCGAGRLTKHLGTLFGEACGVDISDEMIRLGNDRLKSMANIHLYTNNGADLSMFSDNYFDFVFSYIVFQHIPDKNVIVNYIKEAQRVLKPNKIFKFQVQGYLGEEYLNTKKDTWLGATFSKKEIEEIATLTNFEVISMTGQGTQYFWVILRTK